MHEYRCKVVKIIDGDTVDVDIDLGFGVWMRKQRIRMYGIDTPESRTRDLEEKKYGLAAKWFVEEHIPVGSTQILVTMKDGVGKYGRILGKFKLEDGRILNEMMIEQHHAVAYFGQSKDDIAEGHIKNREFIDVTEIKIK